MVAPKNHAGRVTIGLPERLDRAREALRDCEEKLNKIAEVASLSTESTDDIVSEIKRILKETND